ncbi:MAG: S8/S53 family peptidase [Solirubrobacterales bacterium]|nr:S8/S53 family peptidase [Solirubrobacterales bacterium]
MAVFSGCVAGGALAAPGPKASITRVGPAPAAQRLQLVLPLPADLDGLERFATAVTTPGSPEFGQYESVGALARRFGAAAQTRARVVRYLRAVGASAVKIDATGLFAQATMSVRLATRVFGAPIALFRTARGARFTAPAAPARLPVPLQGAVTTVIGLDTRPLTAQSSARSVVRVGRGAARSVVRVGRRAAINVARAGAVAHTTSQPTSARGLSGVPTGCTGGAAAGGFTPNQYLTAYDYSPLQNAGLRGQGERVALIEVDGFAYSDIKMFASCFGLGIPALHGFGVGVSHPLPPGGESTLDLEVLDAAAPDLKEIDVYEASATAANTLEALTAPLQNRGFKPEVISASLGLCEPDVAAAVGLDGIQTTEAALQMAASSGITFLAASGDQGSADCTTFSGTPVDRLAVNYPASSPWVTGVGGTNLILGPGNQIESQLVWNDTSASPGAAGGGGTSDLFQRPAYQNGTVPRNARFVPDVAMLSDIAPGYAVYCTAPSDCVGNGNPNPWVPVGGTSAATPLLAGGLAIVDQELRMHGREQLGFVNPMLYELGRSPAMRRQVFSDVTEFGNDVGPYIPGNGQSLGCCNAGAGYDRASGWGSVDLASFAAVALATRPPTISVSIPKGQRPLQRRAVFARVSCGDACRMGAYAEVQIGRTRPFKIESRAYILTRAGAKTIPLPFTPGQLRAVRSALARRVRVVATVFGVVFASGSGRRILESSPSKRFVVR